MAFEQFLRRRVMCGWFQTSSADCSTLRSATDCEGCWTLRRQFQISWNRPCTWRIWNAWPYFRIEFRTSQQEKRFNHHTRANTVFEVHSLTFARLRSFTFYPVGHLKIIGSSAEIENEEMTPTHFLCLLGNSKQRRDILKDATFLDVSVHALIQMEGILGICCELWLDRQNSTFIKLVMYQVKY